MNKITTFGIGLLIGALILCGCFCISEIVDTFQEMTQPETIELRIEHLWDDNGDYYFADTNGHIYKLGNYKKSGEKIRYDDMPKQRFGMLDKGCAYNCTYISGMDNWISISEKRVEK